MFRVQILSFGFEVDGLGSEVQGEDCRVKDSKLGFKV